MDIYYRFIISRHYGTLQCTYVFVFLYVCIFNKYVCKLFACLLFKRLFVKLGKTNKKWMLYFS